MSEQYLIVTEYDGRFHWWCSCGWDTGSRVQLHQHLGSVKGVRP